MAKEYGSDPEINELLKLYDWVFIPSANPDGYQYSRTHDRMWRKNRRRLNRYCVGVDLNRNFDAGWGGRGSSRLPCDLTYRGPFVFSERESVHLRDAALSARPLAAFFSIHSYSQFILTPYGHTEVKPSDSEELTELALKAAKAMKEVNGLTFTVGTSPDILYITSGTTNDWAKLKAGAKYAYAFELRPSYGDGRGFVLPASDIEPSSRELFSGLKTFAYGFNLEI